MSTYNELSEAFKKGGDNIVSMRIEKPNKVVFGIDGKDFITLESSINWQIEK